MAFGGRRTRLNETEGSGPWVHTCVEWSIMATGAQRRENGNLLKKTREMIRTKLGVVIEAGTPPFTNKRLEPVNGPLRSKARELS